MNYLKSEQFRLIRKKELYLTISISLGLVIAAILALYLSLQADGHFPMGRIVFILKCIVCVPTDFVNWFLSQPTVIRIRY